MVCFCLSSGGHTFGVVESGNADPFRRLPAELFALAGSEEQLCDHLHEVLFLEFEVVVFGAFSAVVDEDEFYLAYDILFGVVE
jgi:hypothetical protein